MRRLLPFAPVLFVLVGSWAAETAAAPVPRDTPPPSIDGKYTLVSVSLPDRVAKGVGKAAAPGGGKAAGGFATTTRTTSTTLVGPAVITKKEIVLENRAAALTGTGTTTMEYTLDPTKSPMTIDVETDNVRGKKTKALGVAEVVGNRLVIAIAREGEERPKTTDEAENVTVYYFQKAPPPPKTEFRIVAMRVGNEAEAEKELNRLAEAGFDLVTTTTPAAANDKAAPTTIHFVLKRTVKQP